MVILLYCPNYYHVWCKPINSQFSIALNTLLYEIVRVIKIIPSSLDTMNDEPSLEMRKTLEQGTIAITITDDKDSAVRCQPSPRGPQHEGEGGEFVYTATGNCARRMQ